MSKLSAELQTYADDGLRLCRAGEWNKGLSVLASVLDQRTPTDQVPGVVYSFLGYGVARYQGKLREGIKLCEHALKIQYYEADNHWNLARCQALGNERQSAHQTIDHGLKLDPTHEGLIATQKELGVRKRPVLGFLSRDNPINVWLGRVRHSIKEPPNNDTPKRPELRRSVPAGSQAKSTATPPAGGRAASASGTPPAARGSVPPRGAAPRSDAKHPIAK